ncbi:MAG: hypothetical protein ACOZQL_34685 [Myxococcota bacterium]
MAAAVSSSAYAQVCEVKAPFVGPHFDDVRAELLVTPQGNSNARIMAIPSGKEGDPFRRTGLQIFPDERNPGASLLLTDDGQGADLRAGDNVFSGFAAFDFNAFVNDTNKRVSLAAAKGLTTTLSFTGRQVTNKEVLTQISVPRAGGSISIRPVGIASTIAFPNSLVINNTLVTQDSTRTFSPCLGGTSMGPWTFGHLMTEMANQPLTGISPSDFVRRWLMSWRFDASINFWNVPKRLSINTVISDWEVASGVPAGGPLDLSIAPFRLVAIVNRMDLHGSIGYSSGSSGETRFVFAYENPSTCIAEQFLVIFEYGNTQSSCGSIKTLAQKWVDLSSETVGSATFNTKLQAITDPIVVRNAAPSKPNGSALNQLRTNENKLNSLWELREFKLFSSGVAPGHLTEDTVKRAPDNSLNGTATLKNCVQNHLPTVWPNPPASTPDILTGTFDPLECPSGTPFRGGANTLPFPSSGFCFTMPGLVGNGAISAADARFEYSFNTCAGCHGGDTQTNPARFTHIGPDGSLSPFLAGPHTKNDCVTTTPRNFDEPTRRAQDLDVLATASCFAVMSHSPVMAVH